MINLQKNKSQFSIYSLICILIFLFFIQRIDFFNLTIVGKEFTIAHLLFIFLIFVNKIKIYHFIVTLFISLYIFFIMMLNDSFFFESFIFITLKIILLFQFSLLLHQKKPTKNDYLVANGCFYIIFLLTFFFSQQNIFFIYDLFNANHSINYLLVYWILIIFIKFNITNQNNLKFIKVNLLPIFFILILAISLKSRQGLLLVLFFFILYSNLNFKNGIIRKIFLNLFIFVIFFLIFYILFNILNEYDSQRLQDLINLETNTRADKKRLELLSFGINNIFEKPFGHGLSNFLNDNPLNLSSHNTYLQLFYELGVISGILIFWIFFSLKKCIKLSRIQKNYYNVLLSLIILTFFIQLIVIDSLGGINLFIVLSFLIYLSFNRKFNCLQKIN